MDKHLEIRLKPFSLRHYRLIEKGDLPNISDQARRRLWATLLQLNESYEYSHESNPGYTYNSSDLEQAENLYIRLLGVQVASNRRPLQIIGERVLRFNIECILDVLECLFAWIDSGRAFEAQRAINDIFRDYQCRWRISEGKAFLVDNEFLEDTVLAEAPSLLALANFGGAREEFQKARNELTEGNIRDAIFYAGASVESVYKAALNNSSKTGIELAQAYANADLLSGIPKPKAQALQKALMPTATLRNELAGHGQGASTLEIPEEYGELAINLAAAINTFISRQHLNRVEMIHPPISEPSFIQAAPLLSKDDDIPF